MQLVEPHERYLSSYIEALQRGWSPDHLRGAIAVQEQLQKIAHDSRKFVADLVQQPTPGDLVTLPDGSTAARLPGHRHWIWDDEFCGLISFRWQPGTTRLPPHCLGHIGYNIAPWKQNRGYATLALSKLLPEVRKKNLEFVEITTDPGNLASQRVIEKNGGVLVERFIKPPQYGCTEGLRFRIFLQ